MLFVAIGTKSDPPDLDMAGAPHAQVMTGYASSVLIAWTKCKGLDVRLPPASPCPASCAQHPKAWRSTGAHKQHWHTLQSQPLPLQGHSAGKQPSSMPPPDALWTNALRLHHSGEAMRRNPEHDPELDPERPKDEDPWLAGECHLVSGQHAPEPPPDPDLGSAAYWSWVMEVRRVPRTLRPEAILARVKDNKPPWPWESMPSLPEAALTPGHLADSCSLVGRPCTAPVAQTGSTEGAVRMSEGLRV